LLAAAAGVALLTGLAVALCRAWLIS